MKLPQQIKGGANSFRSTSYRPDDLHRSSPLLNSQSSFKLYGGLSKSQNKLTASADVLE